MLCFFLGSLPLETPKLSGYWNILNQSREQCDLKKYRMSVKVMPLQLLLFYSAQGSC